MSDYCKSVDQLEFKKQLVSQIDEHIKLKMQLVKQLDKSIADVSMRFQTLKEDFSGIAEQFNGIMSLDEALLQVEQAQKTTIDAPNSRAVNTPRLRVRFYNDIDKKNRVAIAEAKKLENWVAGKGVFANYSPQHTRYMKAKRRAERGLRRAHATKSRQQSKE